MTTERELSEAFAPATIAGLAARLYALRAEIAALKSDEENISKILRNHCEMTGEVIEVEGLPPLRTISRSNGHFWDSTAIRNLIEGSPQEWDRLVEIGAVTLSSTVVRDAIKRNQLVKLPAGGWEKQSIVLTFDKQKGLST